MQVVVWDLTLVLCGIVAAVFLYVRGASRTRAEQVEVQPRAYRIRLVLFLLLILVGLPVSVVTLAGMPRNENGAGTEVVSVTGGQWYWNLDREQVPAGVPVEFRVTSVDVNHGIGIYDPELRLLGQTQAMPGYVNHLRYTFHQPGTYRLLCLEYCGLAHHGMVAELTVVAR